MVIAEKITFEGPHDALVWKSPIEDFNASSQLLVDETHEALLVVNGYAADLFKAGQRPLSVPNIPLAKNLIAIPTDGKSPFTGKVFYINKVHALDLLWGTKTPIALEDPLYGIFINVMVNGSISVSVENARKFMLTLVGFQDQFTAKDLISKFRGIISSHVKDYISQIMINGMLSYFMMNAHLMEVSSVVKEKLDAVFENYGVKVQYFNIETIEVPVADYKKVQEAKERKSSRMIENYSWHDERRMLIAEKMASNPGTMGELNSTVSGLMVSSIVGHSIADIAREALDPSKSKHQPGVQNEEPAFGEPISSGGRKCKCGADLPVNANFCSQCGEQVSVDSHTVLCPACSRQVPKGNFCFNCGYRFGNICPNCGSSILEGSKFCMKCGTKL